MSEVNPAFRHRRTLLLLLLLLCVAAAAVAEAVAISTVSGPQVASDHSAADEKQLRVGLKRWKLFFHLHRLLITSTVALQRPSSCTVRQLRQQRNTFVLATCYARRSLLLHRVVACRCGRWSFRSMYEFIKTVERMTRRHLYVCCCLVLIAVSCLAYPQSLVSITPYIVVHLPRPVASNALFSNVF